jgi:hypothetical protein
VPFSDDVRRGVLDLDISRLQPDESSREPNTLLLDEAHVRQSTRLGEISLIDVHLEDLPGQRGMRGLAGFAI